MFEHIKEVGVGEMGEGTLFPKVTLAKRAIDHKIVLLDGKYFNQYICQEICIVFVLDLFHIADQLWPVDNIIDIIVHT